MRIFKILFALCLVCTAITARADDTEQLAKEAQNPVADLITVPFQDNVNFGIGPTDATQNVLNIQPVIPINLNSDWNLITRTILPVITQPNIIAPGVYPGGNTNGIGDLNPTLFLSPAKPGGLIWGIGPTFILPTATDPILGQGKWSAGPSIVLLTMPGHWVIGILANNVWSFAGQQNRANVNQFLCQYFINYNLPHGWYLTTSPIMTANWEAKASQQWTIPIGGGFGRLFKIGKLPINTQIQGFYNVANPTQGSNWGMRFQLQFLFPK